MQPNTDQPSGNNNQYDFILKSPSQKPKGLAGLFSGGSMGARLGIVAGALLIVIMLGIIIFTVLGSSTTNTEALGILVRRQSELINLASTGAEKASTSTAKNLATTTKLSISSNQTDTAALLGKNGAKILRDSSGAANATAQQTLEEAESAGNFDETFIKVISEELNKYRVSLQSSYTLAKSNNEQQVLQNSFNSVSLLLGDTQ